MPSRSQLALLRRGKEMSDGTGGEAPSGGSGGWPDAGIPATYPNATNTGPTGTLTDVAGDVNVTADGQVVENKRIAGMIRVLFGGTPHHNVIIRNCEINAQEYFAIDGDSCLNLLVENCRITGVGGQGGILIANDSAVRFCDISGYGNGILWSGDGTLMENNYIHDLNQISGDPHYDGMQTGGCSNTMIRYNTIISKDTSHVFLKNDGGAITHVKVIRNQFLADPAGTPAENVYVDGRGSTGALVSYVEVAYNFGDLPVGSTTGAFVSAENTANISVHNNTMTAPVVPALWRIESLYGSLPAPPIDAADTDATGLNLGQVFSVTTACKLTKIRWYRSHTAMGTAAVATLYIDGEDPILAQKTGITVTTAVGWKEAVLDTPYDLSPGNNYCVAVWQAAAAGVLHYCASPSAMNFYLGGNIVKCQTGRMVGNNAKFKYGVTGRPDQTAGGNNFWIDPVVDFLASAGPARPSGYAADPALGFPLKAGYPDATNTGVPDATPLMIYVGAYRGGYANNAVVEGVEVWGQIPLAGATGVTIKNCRIYNNTAVHAIQVTDANPVTVQDCTIRIYTPTGVNGIYGGGTFLRNNIAQCQNALALTLANCVITDNFMHGFYTAGADPHYDGIEMNGGSGHNISHNTILLNAAQTSPIQLNNEFSSLANIVVNNNYLAGGGYTVAIRQKNVGGFTITGMAVTNNQLRSGFYGYSDHDVGTIPPNEAATWTNNVDAVTGAVIPGP